MTPVAYAKKCIELVEFLRGGAKEDADLAAFLDMFELLAEPVIEEGA